MARIYACNLLTGAKKNVYFGISTYFWDPYAWEIIRLKVFSDFHTVKISVYEYTFIKSPFSNPQKNRVMETQNGSRIFF